MLGDLLTGKDPAAVLAKSEPLPGLGVVWISQEHHGPVESLLSLEVIAKAPIGEPHMVSNRGHLLPKLAILFPARVGVYQLADFVWRSPRAVEFDLAVLPAGR